MAEQDAFDWGELANQLKRNARAHAGFFAWTTDRDVEEAGILREFTEELARSGRVFYQSWEQRGRGSDPPDAQAHDAAGRVIAVEVTELVDSAAAAAASRNAPHEWSTWPNLQDHVQRLIDKKGAASPKGGPYSSYVLLIHTDEPGLCLEDVEVMAQNHHFKRPALIDRVFLLMSYNPHVGHYPCYELRLGA